MFHRYQITRVKNTADPAVNLSAALGLLDDRNGVEGVPTKLLGRVVASIYLT